MTRFVDQLGLGDLAEDFQKKMRSQERTDDICIRQEAESMASRQFKIAQKYGESTSWDTLYRRAYNEIVNGR
jgi:hypothetical protein